MNPTLDLSIEWLFLAPGLIVLGAVLIVDLVEDSSLREFFANLGQGLLFGYLILFPVAAIAGVLVVFAVAFLTDIESDSERLLGGIVALVAYLGIAIAYVVVELSGTRSRRRFRRSLARYRTDGRD